MPTGYTSGVADGTVTTFEEYALRCARHFGALIMMRDDPMDAPIPVFEPSDYHIKKLEELRALRKELMQLSPEQIAQRCEAHNKHELEHYLARVEENEVKMKRYAAMLEKAKAFVSPSPDHHEYAKFLVAQLEESMRFDDYAPELPEPLSADDWIEQQISRTQKDIEYHTQEHAKEVERTNGRNKWVAGLKAALKIEHQ